MLHPIHKKIQFHQNYIIKIIIKTSFFKTKLLPSYSDLNLLKLNIFNLEVLKFVFKFQAKLLPHCFDDYCIFNELRKTTDIQRVLLQMKISHSCFVVKQLRKNRFPT